MTQHKIAMLTAGGLAPCLSSAVGGLIERYSELAPDAPMIGYLSGYKGLLQGNAIPVTPEVRRRAHVLHEHGGTPLGNSHPVEGLEFVRTVAAARVMMPKSVVRLSAGRETMSDELQALCFLAGANSIFGGAKLLTTANPAKERDAALWSKLGIRSMPA
mgnify:CR=1 FL=1